MIRTIQVCVLSGLLTLAATSRAGTEIALPAMGTDVSARMSPEEEQNLGAAFMRRIRQDIPVIDDPEVADYIYSLGYQLVAHSEYRNRPFHFFVINDNSINAFAGPGGYIGTNTGLILTAESESEVAAVLAHEIAHITQRHLDRTMDATEKLGLPTAAAIIAAVVLGGNNVAIAEAAIAATLAANMQTQLNFSRAHETESDHIGMQTLAQAGYDPKAMPGFFERLQQNDRLYDAGIPEFLRTHPVTTDRIAESRDRAAQYKNVVKRDQAQFNLIKAKIRVISNGDVQKLAKTYRVEIEEGASRDKRAEIYGYAWALLMSRNYAEARIQAKALLESDQPRIPYLSLMAQIETADGKYAKALELYAAALKSNPGNFPLSHGYATTLLLAGQPKKARETLIGIVKDHPLPPLFELLAKASDDAGFPGAAHEALAEYYFQNGQTQVAIRQLGLALREKDTNVADAVRIETRVKELNELAKLEKEF